MNNVVSTLEGDSGPVRTLMIVWQTQEGFYKYIPADNDIITVRVFDNGKNTITEEECKYKDGKVIIYFPSEVPAGDYDYEVTIVIPDDNNPGKKITKTLLSSKYHVGRR